MEPKLMGRVLTEALRENVKDQYAVELGLIMPDQVRKVTVADALVGTDATLLSLPTRIIEQLGLKKVGTKRVTASSGQTEAAFMRRCG